MRAIRKRVLSRSITGNRVVTTAAGGRSVPSCGPATPPTMTAASTTCFRSGRWSLRVAVLAEAVAAGALEIKRGGVEKDQAQLAEQVVAQREQPLLDEVLGGAWSETTSALVGQFVAEPAHRAVELMQFELADPVDDQPVPPLLGGAVGARVEQPMQHGQKHRAFEIELEPAFAGQFPDHPPAAGLLPQPFESERRAELAGRHFRGLAALVGGQHHGAVGKARTGAQQPIEGAVLRQFVDPAERGDDRLARLAVDALVLDDLEIFGVPGALVAEEHGGPRFNHHILYRYRCKITT